MSMTNESATLNGNLLTLHDLAAKLEMPYMILYRTAARNIFPCQRTSNGMRLVPENDTATLTILANAAKLFHDPELNLSFYDAVNLAKRYIPAELQDS